MKHYILALPILILACTPQSPSVQYSGDLEIGVAQPGTLKIEEPKSFILQLDSNSFVYGFVDQLTVDVVVKLYNEQDEEIAVFDSPARGPEPFQISIESTGKYRLEVSPFEKQTGDYSILLQGVEPIAQDPVKRVDQLLTFYSGDAPGAVIGVVENGELTFSKAYGKANLTHNIDFTLNTPTNIGSVSKQFTAFAILLLEKEGLLSLEDDIRKHIPELPDFGEVITVKNLLNHTNGLREVYNLMPITGWDGQDHLLREEVINIIKEQKELQASPGSEFNYNNSAFIMLAEIVERKTDQKFPAWMKENVFDPLGMTNTYVRGDPKQIIPGASQGYAQDDSGLVEAGDLHAAYGAGTIYTTPGDLTKWLNNFHTPTVGGQAVIEKLTTKGILTKGDTVDYALGIGIGEYKGLTYYAHTGADIAHRASMFYFPEINSGVIALSNNASFSTSTAYTLIDLFFKDKLKEDVKAKKDSAVIEVDPKILRAYTGKYKAASIGLMIEYKFENEGLVAYPTGQPSLKLTPTNDSTFTYQKIEATVVFHRDAKGKTLDAVHAQGGTEYTLTLLPPYAPDIKVLAEYTGKYFCEELETFYTLVVNDTVLVAKHKNLKDIKLTPTEENTFSGDVNFMQEVKFIREAGKVKAFTVSNGRTKGIYFVRY